MKINIQSPKNLGSLHAYSHSRLKVRSPTRPLGTGGQIRIKSRPGAELYTTILVHSLGASRIICRHIDAIPNYQLLRDTLSYTPQKFGM